MENDTLTKFLGFLLDLTVVLCTALILLGFWSAPLWVEIAISITLLLDCGANFNLLKLAVNLVIVLTMFGVWSTPIWLIITIVIVKIIGLGIVYFDN